MTSERIQLDGDRQSTLSKWSTPTAAAVIVKDFCEACNSGFMKDLDCAVKREFAQLACGSTTVLDGRRTAAWASWVTKQALSYQTAYPEDLSDPGMYTRFYRTREPLPLSFVQVGVCESVMPWVHLHARRPMWLTDALGGQRRCGLQVWLAVYGQLVIRVVLTHEPAVVQLMAPDDRRLARLHPSPSDEVDLGSLPEITSEDVSELSKLAGVLTPTVV